MFSGKHAILDITGFVCDYKEAAEIVFILMEESVKHATCRIVAENKVLYDGTLSPVGFSCVKILDESHIACHSYSSLGLCAFDAFTCSNKKESDPSIMIDYIHDNLVKLYPNIKTTKRYLLNRFANEEENNSRIYQDPEDEKTECHDTVEVNLT